MSRSDRRGAQFFLFLFFCFFSNQMSDPPPSLSPPTPPTYNPQPMTSTLHDTRPQTEKRPAPQPAVPWNVVLLDDDHHTYDYVVEMMRKVFRLNPSDALRVATTVDLHKRAVCLTTHKEHAELKRDQILAYGRDHRIDACAGSMSAIIEPAHEPDDNANKS